MMYRLIKKLARSTRGAATVELALITPILTTMLIGVVDVTTAMNRKLELEQAVHRSIERVMQTTTDETVEENIKQEAAEAADIEEDDVIVTYTLTCNGVETDYDTDCAPGDTEVRYVNVSATTTFTPMFPLAHLGMSQSYFTITAETGIRTA
jgi:Flp pilus assembly protein TadG